VRPAGVSKSSLEKVEAIGRFWREHSDVLIPISIAWVAGVFVLSVMYRKLSGKGLFAIVPDQSVFVERRTSGRSLRNLLTQIGGARGCLLVAVTKDILLVRPHFPFTLFFLPEVYGLDLTVPRRAISQVEQRSGMFGRSIVIEFENASGRIEKIALSLRDADGFIAALSK
jgi:hypothetical protein